ncbi:hypothetical protein ADIARSV_4113 [Arcticibacter svalbardensis MN12-7]|uniref:Uncharacterized protein n=1 Tax=Arcticibacter svalbardensis MN12-7 TaxID=1150600 RepID=R9GLM9_9SPHI|nr:hypothetical protein ADIARSV_4113 [Arcticibacter svalbardensis MN12-7]
MGKKYIKSEILLDGSIAIVTGFPAANELNKTESLSVF